MQQPQGPPAPPDFSTTRTAARLYLQLRPAPTSAPPHLVADARVGGSVLLLAGVDVERADKKLLRL